MPALVSGIVVFRPAARLHGFAQLYLVLLAPLAFAAPAGPGHLEHRTG